MRRLFLVLIIPFFLLAEDDTCGGVTVDLREPILCEGFLYTDKGGVIHAPNIRIQAQTISYTKNEELFKVEASGDVIIHYYDYVFVGDYLEYDFMNHLGVIYNGRTGVPPWYFGGRTLLLMPDGSYELYHGYATTSLNENPEWKINTEQATLRGEKYFNAKNVTFRYGRYSLFWLPRFKINLDTIFDNPISYSLRWGGAEGPRFQMKYEVFNWNRWQTFVRFDYRVTRGPGGGMETYYRSADHKESLETINYIARDSSIEQPFIRTRYRWQGLYHRQMVQDKMTLDMSWDKLSDKNFATDYNDKDLELDTAGRTQMTLRRQERWWIGNFLTRVRVNKFETVKQELPTLELGLHPIVLGKTGVISENILRASYLDFEYADDQRNVDDYSSPRVEMRHLSYRPFKVGFLNATPRAGCFAIFYGNSPESGPKWASVGIFGGEVNTHVYRFYHSCKHIATPYMNYEYLTFPTTSPDDHYIFDISDGLYRLNMIRFGMRNNFYVKYADGSVHRKVFVDIFSNAFFDTPTIPGTIPKLYTVISWLPTPRLRQSLDIAWNFPYNQLDHINILNEWTVSDTAAFALEYRHRDRYDWRKAQKQNFILDSFRSVEELLHSGESDRRDTLLLHFYWKYAPTWALELQSRSGWNRIIQPQYNEYIININGTLSSAWNITLSYRHQMDDDRVAVYLNVGINRPDSCRPCFVPSLEF